MKTASTISILVALLGLLLAFHLHDEARRYDVVLAAAGSGGSQQDAGATEFVGYLVDHKTGRVWLLKEGTQLPMRVRDCSFYGNTKETGRGCESETTSAPAKNR